RVIGPAATQKPLHKLVLGDLQFDHCIERVTVLLQDLTENVGLLGVAGKPIEEETRLGIRLRQPLPHHLVGHRVRDELPRIEVTVRVSTQRRTLPNLLAEEVTRRDVRNPEPLGERSRLRIFTYPWRADENYTRHRRNPS